MTGVLEFGTEEIRDQSRGASQEGPANRDDHPTEPPDDPTHSRLSVRQWRCYCHKQHKETHKGESRRPYADFLLHCDPLTRRVCHYQWLRPKTGAVLFVADYMSDQRHCRAPATGRLPFERGCPSDKSQTGS